MTSFRHLSISNKLLSVIMITTCSALALACVVILLYDLLLYRESITQELTTQAAIIGDHSSHALASEDPIHATEIIEALRHEPAITQALIYAKDGRIFAKYQSQINTPLTFPSASETTIFDSLTTSSIVREVFHDGERVGSIYIQSSLEGLFDRWIGFVGIVIGVMFASGLFALVLSTRFQRVISDPILRLTSLAKRISSEKNYSLRERTTSHDEIGTLIQGINDMLEQIQKRDRLLAHHRDKLEKEVDNRTVEIAQLHQQVQRILETAGDGIFGVDTTNTITFLNPAGARMLSCVPDSLVGQSFHASAQHSRSDGTPYPIVESPIYRSCTEGLEFFVDDEMLWRGDGTCFQVEYTSTPMRNPDGTLIGAVVTFRDITERRQVEQAQLEAKQAAEMASQAKSQFLANMSHEIRTPISGVLGMTELLLNSSLSSRQKHFAETALRSGRTLLRIINDILDFSKMEAHKLELDAIEFPLHHTLEDSVELFADNAQSKHLEIVSSIDTHLPEHAVGDPSRLTQVMTNLISNALKFTSQGEVIIRATLETQFTDHFRVRIEVRDSGIGILPAVQEQIFNAFSQADESTTREYGGTGLGLAISKELVELMGGQLQVASDEHHGSLFFFTIPLGHGSQARDNDPAVSFLNNGRVLLIEDHEPTRALIGSWLEQWGMTVCPVGTGEQALQTLRECRESNQFFDFIIIDHTLPDISGLELMPQISAVSLGPTPHCVLLAPWHMTDTETQLTTTIGLQGLVHKPIRRSAMYDALCQVHKWHPGNEANREAAPGTVSHHLSDIRILLAEDHQVNQEIVRAMAEHLHFHLDIVDDGQRAIDALIHQTYDLVLMDWQMPELDGLSACTRIRDQQIHGHRQTHLPIIAFTANNTADDRKLFLEAGIDDVLPKPFHMAQFTSMLAKWLPSALSDVSPTGALLSQDESAPHLPPPLDHTISKSLNPSVLDRIKSLQRPGGPDIVAKVLTTYLNNTPKFLNDLEEGSSQQDSTRIRRAAHTLKSSSASIGAIR
ncbi:MAG: response regulator, partial [Nitrospirota bacterium]|nr:response regulator [Nitrospirota bacterium]